MEDFGAFFGQRVPKMFAESQQVASKYLPAEARDAYTGPQLTEERMSSVASRPQWPNPSSHWAGIPGQQDWSQWESAGGDDHIGHVAFAEPHRELRQPAEPQPARPFKRNIDNGQFFKGFSDASRPVSTFAEEFEAAVPTYELPPAYESPREAFSQPEFEPQRDFGPQRPTATRGGGFQAPKEMEKFTAPKFPSAPEAARPTFDFPDFGLKTSSQFGDGSFDRQSQPEPAAYEVPVKSRPVSSAPFPPPPPSRHVSNNDFRQSFGKDFDFKPLSKGSSEIFRSPQPVPAQTYERPPRKVAEYKPRPQPQPQAAASPERPPPPIVPYRGHIPPGFETPLRPAPAATVSPHSRYPPLHRPTPPRPVASEKPYADQKPSYPSASFADRSNAPADLHLENNFEEETGQHEDRDGGRDIDERGERVSSDRFYSQLNYRKPISRRAPADPWHLERDSGGQYGAVAAYQGGFASDRYDARQFAEDDAAVRDPYEPALRGKFVPDQREEDEEERDPDDDEEGYYVPREARREKKNGGESEDMEVSEDVEGGKPPEQFEARRKAPASFRKRRLHLPGAAVAAAHRHASAPQASSPLLRRQPARPPQAWGARGGQ